MVRAGGNLDRGRDAGIHCCRAQQRGQASRPEHRRVDALREQHRLVEPSLDVATHLFEEPPGRREIGVHRLSEELQIDRERDEELVYAVVKITLDAAAVGIRGDDEPFPRLAQRLDLDAQSIELVARRLELFCLHGCRTPVVNSPETVRRRTPDVKWASTRLTGMAASCHTRLPPP